MIAKHKLSYSNTSKSFKDWNFVLQNIISDSISKYCFPHRPSVYPILLILAILDRSVTKIWIFIGFQQDSSDHRVEEDMKSYILEFGLPWQLQSKFWELWRPDCWARELVRAIGQYAIWDSSRKKLKKPNNKLLESNFARIIIIICTFQIIYNVHFRWKIKKKNFENAPNI